MITLTLYTLTDLYLFNVHLTFAIHPHVWFHTAPQ